MSKLDDIRRMREAKYASKETKDSVSGNNNHGNSHRLTQPVSVQPVQPQDATPGFDRAAYQRKYMRDWRAKRAEELKRLRELVSKE